MRPGEPKKGGGGGMFTWGRIDDSGIHRPITEDPSDPNYDSDPSMESLEHVSNNISPVKPQPVHHSLPLQLSPDHFLFDELSLKVETRAKVDEVFAQGTYSSFVTWLRSFHRTKLHSWIFARTVQVTFDKSESDHDIAWGLIELLYTAKVLSSREMRRGFDRLYRNIQELSIDYPNAAEVILVLLTRIIEAKALNEFSIIRVPSSVYNLGRGSFVLRNIKSQDIVLGDLIEVVASTKEHIVELIKEYYATGVSEGVIDYVKNNKIYGSLIVRKSVELALDRSNKDKELCSRLVAEISGYCSPEVIVEGFDDILWNSKELTIDVPDAPEIISKFLARAIVDDCLPANYIQEAELLQDTETELNILMGSYNLLKPKEAFTSLESVWGPQASTIEDYKAGFKIIIQELFDSNDITNAEVCVKELGCKYYLHEFVKKILEAVMDRTPNEEKIVVQLLKGLETKGILLEEQISTGLERIELNLPQLVLDVPKAAEILQRLKQELNR